MKKMYALIIDGCYCGYNHIEKVDESLYNIILAARDWIENNIDNDKARLAAIEEFADNNFMFVADYFNICDFTME